MLKAPRIIRALAAALLILLTASSLCYARDCYAILADTQDHEIQRQLMGQISEIKPKAVFQAGDLVNNGNDPGEWLIFNRVTAELKSKVPFYPAIGNHDGHSQLYFDEFELPHNEMWYVIKEKGITFVILDVLSSLEKGSEQYRWLEGELASGKAKGFLVVVMHYPVFDLCQHSPIDLTGLCPLFERCGVSIVFSGHTHNYQRFLKNGVFYIVTGGGGGVLRDKLIDEPHNQMFVKEHHFCQLCVDKNELSLTAIGIDGRVIDKVNISRR